MMLWRWHTISPEIKLTLALDSDDPELINRVETSAQTNGIVLERIAQAAPKQDGEAPQAAKGKVI